MKTFFPVAAVLVLCLTACSLPAVSQAQEDEETNYSYGVITSAQAGQIVVKEYDYDTDTETDVTYIIDTGTQFQNAASASDIKSGDMVDVDYIVKGGKNIARMVMVEQEMGMPAGGEEAVYVEEDEVEYEE